eukprot:TRINITY_DN3871_c0_g1_i1.p1 TRINITY_DN3871_c0_g1~~TRINITY_DN3871_c0_g1_i1.p1  ORF type:complete len:256 (-),score=65.46 TRINITY_DN3871_c0_g1_i1:189-956(-)
MSDIDTRFTTAIGLIQDAYVAKTQSLQSEVNRCQQIHQQNSDKIKNLEDDGRNYYRRIAELEAQLADLQFENTSLKDSRANAQEKYNLLKQHAVQLQSLRKQIASIVTTEGSIEPLPELNISPNRDTTNRVSPHRTTTSSAVYGSYSSRLGLSSTPGADVRYESLGTLGNRSTSPHRSTLLSPEIRVDPDAYYQQVRRVLDAQQFLEFTANIKRFNSGAQSMETTLERAKAILGEERPFLFSQFNSLMKQATPSS